MKLNNPSLWGKARKTEIDKLVDRSFKMAVKFLDENPFTALMSVMSEQLDTKKGIDFDLYREAQEMIKARLGSTELA